MKHLTKLKKIAIILAVIVSIQIPLQILYMIHVLKLSVSVSLVGGLVSLVMASIIIPIIYFYKEPETESQDKNSFLQNKFRSLEKPWIRQQVETHLVFGPLSKYIKISWLSLVLIIGYFFFGLIRTSDSFLSYSLSFFKIWWIAILIFYGFSSIPKYRQAAIGWFICKGACLIVVLLLVIGCFLAEDANPSTSLLIATFLLLLWLPSFEFIPIVTPHQKFLTLARIVISYGLFQI